MKQGWSRGGDSAARDGEPSPLFMLDATRAGPRSSNFSRRPEDTVGIRVPLTDGRQSSNMARRIVMFEALTSALEEDGRSLRHRPPRSPAGSESCQGHARCGPSHRARQVLAVPECGVWAWIPFWETAGLGDRCSVSISTTQVPSLSRRA
jgi:hypothetical protein